jgi:sterol 3beta-glucosyltransferase
MRLAIFPLGSIGDVQPYVALAKHAINKGHSAVICTGRSFKNFIMEEGIEFQESESDLMSMLESKEGKAIFAIKSAPHTLLFP